MNKHGSLERHKQVPAAEAPNLVYTMVPLDQLAEIEKEIKHCLLELVSIDHQAELNSSKQGTAS